jgi:hypothetical protein
METQISFEQVYKEIKLARQDIKAIGTALDNLELLLKKRQKAQKKPKR